jgi:hypothetical protein
MPFYPPGQDLPCSCRYYTYRKGLISKFWDMKPAQLVQYSFWWSELRLLIAAVALFIGGVPPIYLIAPSELFGLTRFGLVVAWIISGVAAGYLLYRWYDGGQKIFGGRDHKDTLAFLVLGVSGLNLGFTGVFGYNFGMSVASGRLVFAIVAIIYIATAWHLWSRYKKTHGKIF